MALDGYNKSAWIYAVYQENSDTGAISGERKHGSVTVFLYFSIFLFIDQVLWCTMVCVQ